MPRRALLLVLLLLPSATAQPEDRQILLSEIVADPQTDWTGDGKVTAADEYVELWNPGPDPVVLDGWRLRILDASPSEELLQGVVAPGQAWVVQNPSGDTNNDGHVQLVDDEGRVVDELRYGSWPQSGAPHANAASDLDESLRRLGTWARGVATPGQPNDEARWRLLQTWSHERDGWVAPNATGRIEATVWADAADPLRSLSLARDGSVVASVEAAGARTVLAWDVTLGAQAPHLVWRAERASRIEEREQPVRLDGTPPVLGPLPPLAWAPSNGTFVAAPAADAEVGGITYQWSVPGSAWQAQPEIASNASGRDPIRLRARDGLNNTSDWSAPMRLQVDDAAPSLRDARVAAHDAFLVTWTEHDDGAGMREVLVERREGQQRDGFAVEAGIGRFQDPRPAEQALTYVLTPIDAAGNAGASVLLTPPQPHLHPVVKGIRLSRAVWSQGALDVRVDFDRPMDVARGVELSMRPWEFGVPEGRFLANRSTYLVTLAEPPATSAELTIEVGAAASAQGRGLLRPAATTVWVDMEAPSLRLEPEGGWVRADSVRLAAHDAVGPVTIQWRLLHANQSMVDEGSSRGENASVFWPSDGTWILKAKASDAAGHATKEVRTTFHVDRQPPRLKLAGGSEDGLLEVTVHDAGIGVDWASARVEDPSWRATVDPKRALLRVQAPAEGGDVTLHVADGLGHEALLRLEAAAWSQAETAVSLDGPPPRTAADASADDGTGGRSKVWVPSAAALIGGVAAAIPIQKSRRARRRRAASFALRLRHARGRLAAENGALKEAAPG